ncbi:MAG: 2-C-methyl-D-erythritol 2,4-cyclodiphosphate synthase [Pseudomonadota bacterium]
MRIGHGYDVHAFCKGDFIMLGGVRIAYSHGMKAHSDGDVLIHALCDALLGAAALGDIGRHFPDHDEAFRGIDSRVLLRRVAGLVVQKGYMLNNVDNTVIAQSPKLAPYIDAMRKNLAADLGLAVDRVGIKATTTEGLGFAGRKEGIEVHSVVLIQSGK